MCLCHSDSSLLENTVMIQAIYDKTKWRYQSIAFNMINAIHLLSTLLPMLFMLSFYIYVFLTRMRIGHWPSFYNQDPAVFRTYFDLIFWLHLLTIFSPVMWLGSMILMRYWTHKFSLIPRVVIFVMSWLCFIFMQLFDPGGFLSWWID